MRKIFCLLCILFMVNIAVAQSENAPKIPFYEKAEKVRILSFEPIGSSSFLALSYDFRFNPTHNQWGMKIGVGMIPEILHEKVKLIPSIQANYLFGEKSHKLEVGAGFQLLSLSPLIISPTISLNYRYYAPYTRFVLTVGATNLGVYPIPHLGFGFRL